MSIERFLTAAKSKDEMHRYINELGDDDIAVLLVASDMDSHRYTHFGGVTASQAYFMAHAFADYLMQYVRRLE